MSTADFILGQQPSVLYSLAVCAFFALGCYAAGRLILRRDDVIGMAFGILVCGYVFFAAALFLPPAWLGKAARAVIYLWICAGFAGTYFFFRKFLHDKILLLSGVLFFVLLAGSALLPPYSWDEQVYQVELLARYFRNRSAAVLADNPYSAWPGFLQGLLLPGWICSGLNFPRLFNTLLAVLLAGSLFAALRRYGRPRAFFLTLAAVLSPVALILTRSLYAENLTALFMLSGVFSLYRLRKTPHTACLLAGAFAGAMTAVKLTSGGAAAALFLLCAMEKKNRKYLFLFVLAALAVILPYFYRIWSCTGNPFYPFAASVFGTSQAVESYHLHLGSSRYGMGPVYGTVFGWAAAAFAGRIYDGAVTGFQQLVMLSLLFYYWRFRRSSRFSPWLLRGAAALGVMYLFWGLTSQQTRFLYPGYFLLALLCGAAWSGLEKRAKQIFMLLLCAGIFLSSDLYAQAKHFYIAWRIAGTVRQEPLRFLALSQRDPDFIEILDAVGQTPVNSRILLLFERRGLYVPRHHEIADPGFQGKRFVSIPADVESFMKELDGADYLLLGSNARNVDLQENEIAVQRHLSDLAAAALAQGKLSLVAAGRQNSCHLLKINILKK